MVPVVVVLIVVAVVKSFVIGDAGVVVIPTLKFVVFHPSTAYNPFTFTAEGGLVCTNVSPPDRPKTEIGPCKKLLVENVAATPITPVVSLIL